MDELIHTADGVLKHKGLGEDVANFLISLTGLREEVNGCDFGHEGGDIVRDAGLHAASLCKKYGLKYLDYYEYDEDDYKSRPIYSDGTKGEWEA